MCLSISPKEKGLVVIDLPFFHYRILYVFKCNLFIEFIVYEV